jgi:hypothetical protein
MGNPDLATLTNAYNASLFFGRMSNQRVATRITSGITPIGTLLGGTAANLNDNNTGTVSTSNAIGDLSTSALGSGGRWLTYFDLGSIRVINKVEFVNISQSSGGANFTWYTSMDAANWIPLGSPHLLSTSNSSPSETIYRECRYVIAVVDQINWGGLTITAADMNVYAPTGTVSDMTLVNAAQTVDSVPTKMSAYLSIDPVGSPTLNTDLTLEFSLNGGVNWGAPVTLVSAERLEGSRRLYKAQDVDVSAYVTGTSLQMRLKTLNAKAIDLYGWHMTWE